MRYLLDTNTCIAYLNRSSQSIYAHLSAHTPEDVWICDVVKYELYFGAYKSNRTEKNLKNLAVFFTELMSYHSTVKLPRYVERFEPSCRLREHR